MDQTSRDGENVERYNPAHPHTPNPFLDICKQTSMAQFHCSFILLSVSFAKKSSSYKDDLRMSGDKNKRLPCKCAD